VDGTGICDSVSKNVAKYHLIGQLINQTYRAAISSVCSEEVSFFAYIIVDILMGFQVSDEVDLIRIGYYTT